MIGLKRLKRKLEENIVEDDTYDISGDLKRVKITTTAGELRLQKDIDELQSLTGVKIIRGDLNNTAIIEFDPVSVAQFIAADNSLQILTSSGQQYFQHNQREPLLPTRFLISVQRYYPHHPPQVRCIDSARVAFPPHLYLDGTVHHPSIEGDWTPIKSLHTVVEVLHDLRMFLSSHPDTSIVTSTNNSLPIASPSHTSTGFPSSGMLTPRGVEGIIPDTYQGTQTPTGTPHQLFSSSHDCDMQQISNFTGHMTVDSRNNSGEGRQNLDSDHQADSAMLMDDT